jgi:hypothetical protein
MEEYSMSTYDGAYNGKNNSSTNVIEKKVKEQYQVLEAKFINSYHYHGSMFEYTWEMTLLNNKGETINRKFDTWRDYETLDGTTIEYNGNTFSVIS